MYDGLCLSKCYTKTYIRAALSLNTMARSRSRERKHKQRTTSSDEQELSLEQEVMFLEAENASLRLERDVLKRKAGH